jgi:ankyrin repeat protein
MLAKHGANINAADKQGCTPVLMAAQMGHVDAIKALYKLGANMKPDAMYSLTQVASRQPEALVLIEKILAKMTRECECCGSSSKRLKVCSKCEKVRYCSAECQKQDHKKHKKECLAR